MNNKESTNIDNSQHPLTTLDVINPSDLTDDTLTTDTPNLSSLSTKGFIPLALEFTSVRLDEI